MIILIAVIALAVLVWYLESTSITPDPGSVVVTVVFCAIIVTICAVVVSTTPQSIDHQVTQDYNNLTKRAERTVDIADAVIMLHERPLSDNPYELLNYYPKLSECKPFVDSLVEVDKANQKLIDDLYKLDKADLINLKWDQSPWIGLFVKRYKPSDDYAFPDPLDTYDWKIEPSWSKDDD